MVWGAFIVALEMYTHRLQCTDTLGKLLLPWEANEYRIRVLQPPEFDQAFS